MRRLADIVCNQEPLVMSRTATVRSACKEMRDRRAGSALVVDPAGALVGIFTGRDAVGKVLATGVDASTTTLGEVMTPDPVTMSAKKTAIDALRLMWDGGFRHVPLVDGDRVVGVVSRGDFNGDEHERLEAERALWEHMR